MSVLPEIKNANALIVGATRGIGLGFVNQLLKIDSFAKIYATYRHQASATDLLALEGEYSGKICCLEMDIIDEKQIAEGVASIQFQTDKLHLVIICVGILHEGTIQPEKSLRQVNAENLLRYFQVNSIGALLLAKHLLPLFRHGDRSILATISAKIGSIGDNQIGGWYGYRGSKAALNMFMRNVAIEYRRKSPQTIVVMLHPGTTNTRLSEPFQKNVLPEKLFSVERTTTQLLEVIARLTEADSGEFFSWDGSRLPW